MNVSKIVKSTDDLKSKAMPESSTNVDQEPTATGNNLPVSSDGADADQFKFNK